MSSPLCKLDVFENGVTITWFICTFSSLHLHFIFASSSSSSFDRHSVSLILVGVVVVLGLKFLVSCQLVSWS